MKQLISNYYYNLRLTQQYALPDYIFNLEEEMIKQKDIILDQLFDQTFN